MKPSLTDKIRRPYLMAASCSAPPRGRSDRTRQATANEISPRAINNISRYCTTCWRNARLPEDQWNDCTQEVLARLLKNLSAKAWDKVLAHETDERREFIRAIDAVKKARKRGRWQSAMGVFGAGRRFASR